MSDLHIKIIVGLILTACIMTLFTPYYISGKKIIKPKLNPKYPQDFLIMEILTNQPDLKLFRADIFSGGVTFEYQGEKIRVTKGIGVTVEVDRCIVDRAIAERFYDYLSNKYDCFTPKTFKQYAGMPLN